MKILIVVVAIIYTTLKQERDILRAIGLVLQSHLNLQMKAKMEKKDTLD